MTSTILKTLYFNTLNTLNTIKCYEKIKPIKISKRHANSEKIK